MQDEQALWALGLLAGARARRWMQGHASARDALMAGEPPPRLQAALTEVEGDVDLLIARGRKVLQRDLARVALPGATVESVETCGVLRAAQPPQPFGVVAGARELPALPRLAIVGTRELPSDESARVASWLDALLGEVACAVVSGGAYGVDTLAHEAALRHRRPALIVLAGGLAHAGPSGSRAAYQAIVGAGGTVLSDRPPGLRPRPTCFVDRNARIAALADAVLVVRAPMRSGALSTARAARRLGRVVMAMPGEPQNPRAEGCHALLRRGATLAAHPSDVARALGMLPGGTARQPPLALAVAPPQEAPRDPAERRVWGLLAEGPRRMDAILRDAGLEAGALHTALLALEVRGAIACAPGGWFVRPDVREAAG